MASWKLSIEVTYWSSFKLPHESHTFDLKEKESYPVYLSNDQHVEAFWLR